MCTGDPGINQEIDKDFVAVGFIAKIHGIKGDVKVIPLTDVPDRYTTLKRVYIQTRSGGKREYSIKSTREVKGGLIISFSPTMSISEAEEVVGGHILVSAEEVPKLGRDCYYHFEIIGMEVHVEDSRCLGRIVDIFQTGSNDVYVVRDKDREYLIPAIHDIIKEVDTEKKRMVIFPMEGLID